MSQTASDALQEGLYRALWHVMPCPVYDRPLEGVTPPAVLIDTIREEKLAGTGVQATTVRADVVLFGLDDGLATVDAALDALPRALAQLTLPDSWTLRDVEHRTTERGRADGHTLARVQINALLEAP